MSKKFPDLSGDGKITKKDILMGRGVVKKQRGGEINGLMKMKRGGAVDSPKKKKKFDRGHFFKDAKRAGVDFTGFERSGKKLAGRLATRGYGKAKK